MITGDNLSTASAIAQQIGILKKAEQSITGTQLNELDDAQLAQKISDYTVFARVSPNDKLRIIKAFQSIGETVTVTGNSIADSEALAVADIGCSMGEDGTDVAKGSADIIISNNSFSSVVRAIKESRGMFINIRNAVFYLLSCNFGELLAYLIGMLIFGMPPIAAVPLLWINLLIDCAPAMALSIDKPQDDVMLQHPEYIFKHILNIRGLLSMACQALYIAAITLTAFLCGKSGGTALSSTMAFTTLGIAQLLHTFNIRAPHSIFKTKFNIDEFIGISSVITIFTMLFIVLTPVGAVFGLEILTTSQLAVSIALAISVIPFCEFLKLIQSFLLKRRGF